jgi:Fic family protein
MKNEPPYKITNSILNYVGKITELVTIFEISRSNIITPKLRKKCLIKTITGTLQIEGNTLDEEEITAIIEGKRVLATPKEIAEVKGAIELYQSIDIFDYKKLEDILKAHQILMKEILINSGKFRDKNVGVGGEKAIVHIAPPSNKVPALMASLFKWLKNTDIHPLIKSSVFHYELEFIHPFIDGNGRIGRFWQTLILYKWKPVFGSIPVESLIKENQQEYYEALKISDSLGESTPFIEFMLKIIFDACNGMLNENAPKKVPRNVPKERLDKIVKLIKENKFITINEIAEILKVSSKTIKRDIAKLKEKGMLKREGSLKTGYWKLIEGYIEKGS